MATHKSSEKRNRQTITKNERNTLIRSQVRTAIRAARDAMKAGDKKAVLENLRRAESVISSATKKGIFHRKNASRKISRLAKVAARVAK